jgi:hypothetical protein
MNLCFLENYAMFSVQNYVYMLNSILRNKLPKDLPKKSNLLLSHNKLKPEAKSAGKME